MLVGVYLLTRKKFKFTYLCKNLRQIYQNNAKENGDYNAYNYLIRPNTLV